MKLSNIFGNNGPIAPTNFDSDSRGFSTYLGISKEALVEMKYVVNKFSYVFDVPTLLGVEIEVENVGKEVAVPKFWIQEADGSLRNNGKEFKSVPLTPEQTMWALALLWQVLYKSSGVKPDFSWRSSIHVHLNALWMEEEEFKKLLVLGLLFEDVFFKVVGQDRDQSNFCVPLCRSTLMQSIKSYLNGKNSLKHFFAHWNGITPGADHGSGHFKYAAINFSRLGDLGTVEFRHLGGTNKLSLVLMWLSIILQLYRAAVQMDMKTIKERVNSLNTTLKYEAFVKEVFGTRIADSLSSEDLSMLMHGTITKTKELFASPPKFKVSGDSAMVGYAKHLHKKQAAKGDVKPTKK